MPSLKGRIFRKPRYRESQVLADVDKLLSAYKAAGYLSARVARGEILASETDDEVSLRINITEGRRTYVRSIRIAGNEAVPLEEISDAIRSSPGAAFDPALLSSDSYRIYSIYADRGYTSADVAADSVVAADSADIAFDIVEGEIAYVGSIRVEGNSSTLGRAIRRELLIHEGDVFSRRRILESQARLYRTALFSSVAFESDGLEAESTVVDLVVRVQEKQQRWVGFGVGYGTLDFLRLSGDWTHRNLFGSLVRGEARVVASRLLSEQNNNVRGEFTLVEPWFLGMRTEAAVSVFHERRDVENFEILIGERRGERIASYRLTETGVRPSLARALTPRLKATLGYNLTTANPEDPSSPVDPQLLGREVKRSLDFTLERNGRNDFFNPTRGSHLRGNTEVAGKALGGDSHFLRGRAAASVYRPVFWNSVIAARFEVGSIRTLTDSTGIPDHERFRLGGATTVRGYEEQEIGPGNFLLISNIEWRVPIVWKFGGAIFMDGGNTWGELSDVRGADFRFSADPASVGGGDMRYSAGIGIRLATPVGPARVDYAQKLKRARFSDGRLEDPWGIHLSLGQAF